MKLSILQSPARIQRVPATPMNFDNLIHLLYQEVLKDVDNEASLQSRVPARTPLPTIAPEVSVAPAASEAQAVPAAPAGQTQTQTPVTVLLSRATPGHTLMARSVRGSLLWHPS